MNHAHDPTFAVHPHSSVIFSHRESKAEPQGATPKLLTLSFAWTRRDWLPTNFTIHSAFKVAICRWQHLATLTSYFCYIEISPFSRQDVLFGFPMYYLDFHTSFLQDSLLIKGLPSIKPSIITSKSSLLFTANNSTIYVFVGGFRLLIKHHYFIKDESLQVSLQNSAWITIHLESLVCFIHRVDHKHGSYIDLSRF